MQPGSHIITYNFASCLTENTQYVSITTGSCYFMGDMSVQFKENAEIIQQVVNMASIVF